VTGIGRDSGALDYTRRLAAEQAQLALQSLSALSASEYRDSLESLVKFSVDRQS
ncbi:MAG: octaprenyl diphosphate synthase, partial [Proteobacteria bacterium]|nr:octaprenyl diphosphate synthase [Pseudomonadota bacterium]